MAKKIAIKKKIKTSAKPIKKAAKPPKKLVKNKKSGIFFKVPFGNITFSGNALPTASTPPGMAFPISYQLTFTGKNKNIIVPGQTQIGFSFLNGAWTFQGVAPEFQQQGPIQQMANSIGIIIMNSFQNK